MKKEASLPIRLDTDLSRRLDRAADRLGLTKSALIRILVKSFVDELEAAGGKMTLPFSWQEQKRSSPLPR
ncbi:MAG: ribbon-helix-helix protein, CopG family [Kiritimatiellia bacterium]